jgi:SAM-dependent methyltransferase
VSSAESPVLDVGATPAVPGGHHDLPALYRSVSARYLGGSRTGRHFVPSKLKRDPATAVVLREAARRPGGFGHVVDLGCGRGQLSLALLLGGLATRVSGYDLDAVRVRDARLAAQGLPAEFGEADLNRPDLPAGDTLMLMDVLYLLPEEAQLNLLAAMAAAARQLLVIRTVDPAAGWRSRVGRGMELLNRRLRGEAATGLCMMPVGRVQALLDAHGFDSTVRPCWEGTPFPNVLLMARRRG